MEDVVAIAERWSDNACSGICLKRDGTVAVTNGIDHRVYAFRPGNARPAVLAGDEYPGVTDEPRTDARFRSPRGIAVFVDGSLVVADRWNHRIRKISPDGRVTTVAGSTQGFADGLADAAMFNEPRNVAVRADGSIVVADTLNNRIRLISPDGLVTTLAGSEALGFADGSAAEAKFWHPYDVAVCPDGAVLVCDFGGSRIRRIRITADGTTVETVAGHMEWWVDNRVKNPCSIAVDTTGNAVFGEYEGRIQKINLATGEVTTVGVFGAFNKPISALAIDVVGNIVFFNPVTQKLNKIIHTGLGPGVSAEPFLPVWTPTRESHWATPKWSRDAVGIVLLASTRASTNGPGSGWLGRVPILPREMWEMIIGLIPRYHIGRLASAAPVRDQDLELWLEQQMRIDAEGGWGGVEEDTEDE